MSKEISFILWPNQDYELKIPGLMHRRLAEINDSEGNIVGIKISKSRTVTIPKRMTNTLADRLKKRLTEVGSYMDISKKHQKSVHGCAKHAGIKICYRTTDKGKLRVFRIF